MRDAADPGTLRQVFGHVQSGGPVARRVALGALVGLLLVAVLAAAA